MSSFRIVAVVVLAFAGVAGSLGYVSFMSDPPLEPVRILFVGNTETPEFDAMLRGARAAAGDLRSELEVCDLASPQPSADWRSDRLASRYDGVLLASPSAGTMEFSPDADARLKIVSIGKHPEGVEPLVYVELNAYQLAHTVAQLLRECLPVGGAGRPAHYRCGKRRASRSS